MHTCTSGNLKKCFCTYLQPEMLCCYQLLWSILWGAVQPRPIKVCLQVGWSGYKEYLALGLHFTQCVINTTTKSVPDCRIRSGWILSCNRADTQHSGASGSKRIDESETYKLCCHGGTGPNMDLVEFRADSDLSSSFQKCISVALQENTLKRCQNWKDGPNTRQVLLCLLRDWIFKQLQWDYANCEISFAWMKQNLAGHCSGSTTPIVS